MPGHRGGAREGEGGTKDEARRLLLHQLHRKEHTGRSTQPALEYAAVNQQPSVSPL